MKTTLRRIAVLCVMAALLLSVVPVASAYSYYDNYPSYIVESTSPNGYCYLYSKPSSSSGRNLGRYNNGEIVKVIDYYGGNGYCFVVCRDGKTGYIHDYALTPASEPLDRELYRVYSTDPPGYCYMYDAPDDINGRNMGRYDNGEYIEIVDWDAHYKYAEVRAQRTGKYGYIRKTCLVPEWDYKPIELWAYVDSTSPNGYCYMYSKPNSSTGSNLGRYNNGEWVRVIDWDASDSYAQVEGRNGKIGYIKKSSLSW